LLGLLALILLSQVFVVHQALENATLGFQIMLGEAFEPLLDRLARSVQSILCVSSGVLLAGGGIVFALGRALLRISRQNQRIQELEAQLAMQTDRDASGQAGAGDSPETS
jgi:hypothetical protein